MVATRRRPPIGPQPLLAVVSLSESTAEATPILAKIKRRLTVGRVEGKRQSNTTALSCHGGLGLRRKAGTRSGFPA
jgi:hypothetical protein